MKISVIYFTYHNDAEILEQSIISLEKQLDNIDYKIYIFDDGNDPLDPIFPEIFEKNPKITYYRTNYDRQKNLNGQENNEAEAYIFQDICEKDQSDFIIKIDSDIYCPNNFRKWVEEFYKSDKLYTGGYIVQPKYGICYFSGGCYMIKRECLKPLFQDIRKFRTFHLFAPEDYIMCSRLERLFPDKGLRTHRVYVTGTCLGTGDIVGGAGYHLDPRFLSKDLDILKFIKETGIYIATWDAIFETKFPARDLKDLQLKIFKNLNNQ